MVTYIRSDLEFILAQIRIAEAHAAGQPLYGPGGLIPTYNLSWGLRTVDGSYNNLLHPTWGAADHPFPSILDPDYRPVTPGTVDFDGPGPALPVPTAPNYDPSNNASNIVMDPSLRTISNLIVDQTLDNTAAIMVALSRAGVESATDQLAIATTIKTEYQEVKPFLEAAEDANLANAVAQRTLAAAQQAHNEAPTAETQAALDAATAAAATTQTAADLANADLAANRVELDALLTANGIEMDGDNINISNVAPDEGLSASFNSWFTLFGQFFDHGLDLVAKGGSGTVYIPLQPDDPLYDPTSPTNFMVLTRATVGPGADNVMGTADDVAPVNVTTSFVDQNQTYTSHPSHQVFLREYTLVNGRPEATGRLLDGANGGLPTWGEIKEQARTILGIDLTDYHVGNLPLLATDLYGNFIPNPATGFPQVVMVGPPQTLASGTPASPLSLVTVGPDGADPGTLPDVTHLAVRTGHAFLDDIAHTAAPTGKLADGDIEIGLGNLDPNQFYDQALLDAHFITGDGRGNENIGLTAVHHVFHSEHNRLMDHTMLVTLQTRDLAFINEWLDTDLTAEQVAAMPTDDAGLAAYAATLNWDGERLFQAAKFGTEMQYQHLVFEEFARKIQPNINVFLVPDGFDVTLDPTIVAEFAHVVYRFGHSMLTETIDRFDPAFADGSIGLIEGFLNPIEFASLGSEAMAGSIIRGMTRQVGNEIDEFVTSALRNNLLGLPLDLATINLARGRDTGVPSLNAARREFYELTNQNAFLKPYESWVDYAGHLKNEASIINFIAAYGTHELITSQTTVEGKRDAALTIILGQSFGGLEVPADAQDFLNGQGQYAADLGGLELVDLWIGGLAEEIMPFGGMLGSTFNFVFEGMMENLQSGDRFYYLQRLDGLHLFGEMENNSFAAMIMRNTDATHLPSDVFSTPGLILEVDQSRQFNDIDGDGDLESDDPTGGGLLTQVVSRNNPSTPGADENYLRYTGGDHVLLGGTEGNDTLISGIGDDTLYGDGGNDRLEGGQGNDIINAGAGDDIITDTGGDDNVKAGDGNDVVHSGGGLDLVMGGRGQDFIFLGTDAGSEVFAGEGNDFIYGNKNAERILGNEGDDWIETGTFDGAPGDNFDEIFSHDSVDGHDVFRGDGGFDEFIGEGGDDIMVGSPGRGKMAGMSGFDWATYFDATQGVNADLSRPIIFDEAPTIPANAALDEFQSMEGLSGSRFNDVLSGSNITAEERLPVSQGGAGAEGYRGSQLTKEGVARIVGLQQVLGLTDAQFAGLAAGSVVYFAGDIILGGDGSDRIQGNAGDDIIDGDKYLEVSIGVYANGADGSIGTGALIATYRSMTELSTLMFNGTYNPGQLKIIREIKTDTTAGDTDVAVFQGLRGEYAFSATADGQVIVTHAVEDSLDGVDRLRNIEQAQFADGGALNIRVGTDGNDVITGTAQDDLILGLGGNDFLMGGDGNDILVGGPNGASSSSTFIDDFGGAASYTDNNGTANFTGGWTEGGGETGNSPTAGDINISGGRLRFQGDGGIDGGEFISRAANLTGFTSATVTFNWEGDDLDGGENVQVQAWNGLAWENLGTALGGDGNGNFSIALTAAQIGSHTQIRFLANGSFDAGENFFVDNFTITASAAETLNGGNGNDTYSFTFGDGNDLINELANGGAADRISILSPNIDPVSGLPVITGLNAFDSNGGTQNGNLVISYEGQQITVSGHYGGTNAQTGVELINFNGATYNGYLLEGDYAISRADPGNRDAGGVNLSTNAVTNAQQNFVAGEDGTNDQIIGGALNDLIFGGTGDNELNGGDGDDLLVGGSGAGDNDLLNGGAGADTMVGLAGSDTYVVDDAADVVVEAAGAGTDTVQTDLAVLSIEGFANVENLTYTGVDADQFVGTGNAANNVITGGDLADTLSGLAGDDRLDGGIGADTMTGGANNDTYVVDDAGDVVVEVAGGGIDTIETSLDFTLSATSEVENLILTGAAVVARGNANANTLAGNDAANELYGGGGADNVNGGDGADLIDGGEGDDTLSGGGGGDADFIIGGAGNDIIDVGSGNDVIRYAASGFGNDVVNNFDAAPGGGGQDQIDLRALGVTAANFGARVTIEDVVDAGTDDTRVTVRDAGGSVIGTIFIEEVDGLDITATDFLLAPNTLNTINGTAAGATHTGAAAADAINGLGGNDTLNGQGGDDQLTGGTGNDSVNGGDGDDIIFWNANAAPGNSNALADGRDIVNGGAEGTGGDTFVITGNANAEQYRIYTRAAWDALTGNNGSSLNAATEIVITRGANTDFANSVIAELRDIEEIRINGFDPSGSGIIGGDTIQVIGDFSTTSLRLNTITIDGSLASDTIDISALTSDHRIVFNTNGGSDVVVGELRPQDVVNGELAMGDSVPGGAWCYTPDQPAKPAPVAVVADEPQSSAEPWCYTPTVGDKPGAAAVVVVDETAAPTSWCVAIEADKTSVWETSDTDQPANPWCGVIDGIEKGTAGIAPVVSDDFSAYVTRSEEIMEARLAQGVLVP
jgi:Ca2+-binding RTX toxin-like protein